MNISFKLQEMICIFLTKIFASFFKLTDCLVNLLKGNCFFMLKFLVVVSREINRQAQLVSLNYLAILKLLYSNFLKIPFILVTLIAFSI